MIFEVVLDTSALMAYKRSEPGAEKTFATLSRNVCAMHAINASEICCALPRKHPDIHDIRTIRAWLVGIGIAIVYNFDEKWLIALAEIRLRARSLSIGDAAAVALAASLDVPVLTADRAFLEASSFADILLIR